MSATKALVAYHHATYGGVYYSADIDFTNSAVQPTWTRYATTGLANNLVKVMQNDPVAPYDKIYVQLDNGDIYLWNGSSWDKILDLATARTLTSFPAGAFGFIAQDKLIAGHIYIPITSGSIGVQPKIIYSFDYGATWAAMTVTFGGGIANSSLDRMNVADGKIWYCSSNIYRSLFYYDGSWHGDFNIWPNTGSGEQINIDPTDPTACYYKKSASDNDLTKFYYSGGYSSSELQNSKDLGVCFDISVVASGHSSAGCQWFSPLTNGKQRVIKRASLTTYMYQTADGWANLVEASPTDWGAIIDLVPVAQNAALENDTYVLIGCGNDPAGAGQERVYAWVATSNTSTSQPWAASGTNHNTAPYTDAIPSVDAAYTAVYGVFVGEAPATKGVYVYADEQGDITDIPDYDGLGTPLFGDRASWRDRVDDGFNPYHAQDVEQDEHELHTPEPTGVLKQTIVEAASGYWDVSGEAVAYESQLHDAVTLDADAAVILDLQGAGGQEIGLDVQNANTVLAGPTSGAANEPTFRAITLANGDIGDVVITSPVDAAPLIYNTASSKWIDGKFTLHEHVTNEDHSGECDGSEDTFSTLLPFRDNSTQVYLNGVRQYLYTDYTEAATFDSITFTTPPEATDTLILDYIVNYADFATLDALLLETGDYLLLENGDRLLLE